MVWGLIPIDSLRGVDKYYIFSKGTYRVGRKDCDIIVQTDTSISRQHAEIAVSEMISQDSSSPDSGKFSSHVCVIDRSKYGTVINKELGTVAIKLQKNQDATLKDGDSVTFGTCNATFRFCFIPFKFYVNGSKSIREDPSFQATISSIGASTSFNWSAECTHVLVEESSPITLDLVKAVIARKPVVLIDWVKVLAEKRIETKVPSCMSYVPTLILEGTPIRTVDPGIRDKCLEGFTFVLGSSQKYKFGEKFHLLLEVVGAKFLSIDEFISNSQTSTDGENNHVLVLPGESPNEFNLVQELSSLSRVTDVKLVAAILSGQFDSSIMEPPSIVVSSSHSTDETIVADSDVEIDTATSDHVPESIKFEDAINYGHIEQAAEKTEARENTRRHQEIEKGSDYLSASSNKMEQSSPKGEDAISMKRMEKGEDILADRHENSDIIFSQDLIVRNATVPIPLKSTTQQVVNFKCFRKMETLSGNSFKDLIPFSKDPYKESDCNSNESEYMREERKRKQLEAIAEDLFNNEKAKKRAAAGTSLEAFLGRR